MVKACVFCEIVAGKSPAYIVWEDRKYLAFLSIFPNTDGFTVVISKKHYPSYYFDLPDRILIELTLAAKKVAKKIDDAFGDVGRTGLIAEGMTVDHVHLKLVPLHGTKSDSWKQRLSKIDKYFDKYEGYISSHNYKREDDEKLVKIALKIRKSQV